MSRGHLPPKSKATQRMTELRVREIADQAISSMLMSDAWEKREHVEQLCNDAVHRTVGRDTARLIGEVKFWTRAMAVDWQLHGWLIVIAVGWSMLAAVTSLACLVWTVTQ